MKKQAREEVEAAVAAANEGVLQLLQDIKGGWVGTFTDRSLTRWRRASQSDQALRNIR